MLPDVCPGEFLSRGAIYQHQVIVDIRECPVNLKNSRACIIAHNERLWKAPRSLFYMETHLRQLSPFLSYTCTGRHCVSSRCGANCAHVTVAHSLSNSVSRTCMGPRQCTRSYSLSVGDMDRRNVPL